MIRHGLHRKISLESFCLGVLVFSFSIFSPGAIANTVSQSLDFRLNQNNLASTLTYNPFDSSLGTLENIGISFAATRRHAWGIWNISGATSAVPYDVTLANTTLTLDSNVFGFSDLHYGPGVTPVLDSTSYTGYGTAVKAGTAEFLAGSDPVFASAYQPGTTLTGISGSFAPSPAFTGTLNLAYAYDPGVFGITSSGFLSTSLIDVSGTATVTYTYQVPDSPLGPTLGMVLAGLALVARTRRSKKTAA